MEITEYRKHLATTPAVYPRIDFEKAVAWCEQRTGKTLAPSQREALKTVLANRVAIITGRPGLGKTTLVNSILMILRAKGVKCLLCAPTGTGREAAHRDHGNVGEDHSSPPGGRSGHGKVPGIAVRNEQLRKRYSGLQSSLNNFTRQKVTIRE